MRKIRSKCIRNEEFSLTFHIGSTIFFVPNLEMIHIEKNICDNLLGTSLDLEGKSEDNLKA